MRIVYLGTPDFAVAGLQALVENGYNIVAVVTMPDKPAGRGHQMQFSPVKEYALSQGIPVLQPEKLKDPEFVEQLRSYQADLQIVTAFRMLPEVVWAMPRLGTFNVHGSLLPQYRGAAPINWAVINGEKETGLTTFMLKHEIDTGNMILQERIAIGDNEDVGSVHDRLMELSKQMVLKTVRLIEECDREGKPLPTVPQPELPDLKPAPKIFKEDCQIDFTKTAREIHNFVRGLSPYPGAWTDDQRMLSVCKASPIKVFKVAISPVPEQKGHIIVPCADGYINILELQAPGKKRMDAKSYLNGLH
ncbi:MAG: methionyl-tRNA formyltransferase [Paludibacteraceae bacterium]|nr:methionyl-tRNA formyltransferase [Paludibacteraceae bacterium]